MSDYFPQRNEVSASDGAAVRYDQDAMLDPDVEPILAEDGFVCPAVIEDIRTSGKNVVWSDEPILGGDTRATDEETSTPWTSALLSGAARGRMNEYCLRMDRRTTDE